MFEFKEMISILLNSMTTFIMNKASIGYYSSK